MSTEPVKPGCALTEIVTGEVVVPTSVETDDGEREIVKFGVRPDDVPPAPQIVRVTTPVSSAWVSLDGLEEFRIQTSTFAPEYGRTPGAQVSVVTKSGTNRFHGTAFEYFRNDVLDANDWFADNLSQKA